MDNRNPLDDITNSEFIYDALRVAVVVILIALLTYLFCEMFNVKAFI